MVRNLEKSRGTYLLLAWLKHPVQIRVGRLGTFDFAAGWYAYTGSALGPGGLASRLARHARTAKRLHWHVDYLLQHAVGSRVWATAYPERLECAWAEAVRNLAGAQMPVPGFGASDCRCATHLAFLAHRPSEQQISVALSSQTPAQARLWSMAWPAS